MPSPAASVATGSRTSLSCVNALLRLAALLAAHPAVDRDHRLGAAQAASDPLFEIVQRVAVLGEDDELAAMAVGRRTSLRGLAEIDESSSHFGRCRSCGRCSASASRRLQRLDLGLQFGDGPRGRRLIDDLLLGLLDLVVGRVVEVVESSLVGQGSSVIDRKLIGAALAGAALRAGAFQPLAAASQRLVDRLGRGGQPPLQDGQREADGALARRRSRAPRPG